MRTVSEVVDLNDCPQRGYRNVSNSIEKKLISNYSMFLIIEVVTNSTKICKSVLRKTLFRYTQNYWMGIYNIALGDIRRRKFQNGIVTSRVCN